MRKPKIAVNRVMTSTNKKTELVKREPATNQANNPAVGKQRAEIAAPTQMIGMSRSCLFTTDLPPELALRTDDEMLAIIGLIKVMTVHSPPTAMMPAPINLT